MRNLLLTALVLALLALFVAVVEAQTQSQTATFNLMWTDNNVGATQEDGSIIERSATPTGTFSKVGQVAASVTSFSDVIANDPGNVQQCYRVIAFNAVGASQPSNVACGTSPVVKLAPGMPGNISVSVTVEIKPIP